MPKIMTLALIILMFVTGTSTGVSAQDGHIFRYAYLTPSAGNRLQVRLIDPAHPQDTSAYFSLVVPDRHVFEDLEPSPNGDWYAVTFVSETADSTIIELLNPETGEIRPVAELRYQQVFEGETLPKWSSNGEFLAFIGCYETGAPFGVYVYSPVTDTVSPVTVGTSMLSPYRLTWSPNDEQLAVVNENCAIRESCPQVISVYDVPQNVLSFAVLINIGAGGPLCNLQWSPNGMYLSFEAVCGEVNSDFAHELFLLDIPERSITQLTHFTNQLPLSAPEQLEIFHTEYSTVWLDDSTLIVGVSNATVGSSGLDPETLRVQTLSYTVPGGESTLLSADEAAFELAIEPLSRRIAYRSEQRSVQPQIEILNAEIRVSAFTNQTLTAMAAARPGCNLQWSPDGAFLAYTILPEWDYVGRLCITPAQGLVFVDSGTLQVTEYIAPEPEAWWPIGWVPVPAAAIEQ